MKIFFRNIFLLVNILVAIAMVITYLVPYADPRSLWVIPMFGLFQLYLLLINLAFIVCWLLFNRKLALVSMVVLLFGFGNIGNFIRFSPRRSPEYNGIKILSYNVHHFYSYFQGKKKDTSVLRFIAAQEADIICLQETALQRKGELSYHNLKNSFPGIKHCHLAHMNQSGGPVTFTRFPIINMGEIKFDGTNNMVIYTDILYLKDTMRIYNCHLQSFGILKEEYSIVDSLSFEAEKIMEARTLGGKLKRGNSKRAEQVKILSEHIKNCPYERIIVCGDFNDIPNSYTHSRMKRLLNDSFVGSGTGTSNTFRHKIAPFRIDYVFHSDHFKSYNYTRHRVDYSDHYPVTVFLKHKNRND